MHKGFARGLVLPLVRVEAKTFELLPLLSVEHFSKL